MSSPSSCTETCGRILSVPVNAPDIYAHAARVHPRGKSDTPPETFRHLVPPPLAPPTGLHSEYSWPSGACFLPDLPAGNQHQPISYSRLMIIRNVLHYRRFLAGFLPLTSSTTSSSSGDARTRGHSDIYANPVAAYSLNYREITFLFKRERYWLSRTPFVAKSTSLFFTRTPVEMGVYKCARN